MYPVLKGSPARAGNARLLPPLDHVADIVVRLFRVAGPSLAEGFF